MRCYLFAIFSILCSLFCTGAKVLAFSADFPVIRIGGVGAALAHIRYINDAYNKLYPYSSLDIPLYLDNEGTIKAVMQGVLDIGLISRRPSLSELEFLEEIPYAKTPLIFVTSKLETPNNLETETIQNIYRGEKFFWPDHTPIRLLLRPPNNQASMILKTYFPGLSHNILETQSKRSIPIIYSDLENVDLAERIPGSFAVTTLTSVISDNRRVKIFFLNGIVPSVENLEKGKYPLAQTLYIIFRKDFAIHVKNYIDFISSIESTIILRSLGNVPLLEEGTK